MQDNQQYPPLSEADIPQLLQLLQTALSPDPNLQKQAEALLGTLGTRVGYCSCLAAIVGNHEADHSARWLAAVQLKNNVNKFWKSRYDRSGLTSEEKGYLRGKLLQLIPQEDNQIAVQVALVISKVARFDFPQQWPSLFHDLMAGIAAAAAASDGQQQQQQTQSVLLVRRTYFVLHHVLKELSSKRLAADQKAFAEVTSLLFDHVWGSWRSLCSDLLSAVPAALATGQAAAAAAAPTLLLAFERWLLLLKIIRRLLLFGFQSDAKSLQPVAAVGLVAPELLQAAAALAAARHSSSSSSSSSSVGRSQLSVMVERGLLKIIKTLSQVQQEHPWSFHHAGVLLPTLDICYSQLLAAAGGGPFPPAREALLTSCCNTILGVLTCAGYQGKLGSGTGTTEERAASIKQMSEDVSRHLTSWWSAAATLPDIPALAAAAAAAGQQQQQQQQFHRAAVLLQTLVAGYFALTHRDLEEWSTDGEQWAYANSDLADLTEGLRPCCHQLTLTLVLYNKAELAPVLLNMLKTVSTVVPAGWMPQQQQQQQQLPGPVVTVPGGSSYHGVLLLKEAVYEAVGLAAYELHEFVDYQGWLRSSLLPDMMAIQQQQQQQQRLLPLLPRAAARLIGRWVADLKAEDRPAVYNALTLLLVQPQQQQQQQHADVVLQLAAVSALRTLIDDFGFESDCFVPVLPAVVAAVTGMLRESDELDTQNQAFGLLNLIIDRLGPSDLHPHVSTILPLLPDIWATAEDQSLLRIQVLCCLSLLVNVLGSDSHLTYSIILPILRQALHPSSSQPELLEDALCLWLVALRNAPSGQQQQQQQGVAAAAAAGVEGLFELTPALTACLTSSTEHIYIGMQILSSLLLLGGGQFLATYGPQLLAACTAYVGEVVERGLLLLLPPMDLLVVAAPHQAATMMSPFMQRLLGLVMSGRESGVVVANSLALFGRLLLQAPSSFEQLLGSAAAAAVAGVGTQSGLVVGQAAASGPEGLLVALVSLWCDAFDSIVQPLARKLAACALATLIGLPVKALLHQLPVLLSNIVSVWLEVEASGDDDPNTDRGELFYGQGLWSGGHSSSSGFDDACGFGDGGALLGQSLTASEEAEGECARKQALRDAEPLRHIKISRLLSDKLAAAAAAHGQDFATVMAAMDPAIAQQVQTVMAAAATTAHAGQRQC